jgi:O-antigen/teichoic acid export membrane protein
LGSQRGKTTVQNCFERSDKDNAAFPDGVRLLKKSLGGPLGFALNYLHRLFALAVKKDAISSTVRGAATLFSGNATAGILALVGLAVIARALSPQAFGQLAMITAYGMIFSRLLAFQSSKVFIHLASENEAVRNRDRWIAVLNAALFLDVTSAVLASAVAIGCIPVVAIAWKLSSDNLIVLFTISVAIATSGTGFAVGLLRMRNRYRTIATHLALSGAAKLAGVLLIASVSPTLLAFAIWTAIMIAATNLSLVILAIRSLSDEERTKLQLTAGWRTVHRDRQMLRKFLLSNLDAGIRAIREFDVPLVGVLAGSTEVGFYKIARQIAGILQITLDQFAYVVYPQLARVATDRNRSLFDRLILQSSFWIGSLAFGCTVVFIMTGPFLITFVFGSAYSSAYLPASICLGAVTFYGVSQAFGPALHALGKFGAFAMAHLIVTAAYLIALSVLAYLYSAAGAAYASMVLYGSWALLSFGYLLRARRSSFGI